MIPSRYVSSVKVISDNGMESDGLVSIEHRYNVLDGRGHIRGYIWVKECPVHIDAAKNFTLRMPDGRTLRAWITRSHSYRDKDGSQSLEVEFVEQSHIRESQ